MISMDPDCKKMCSILVFGSVSHFEAGCTLFCMQNLNHCCIPIREADSFLVNPKIGEA